MQSVGVLEAAPAPLIIDTEVSSQSVPNVVAEYPVGVPVPEQTEAVPLS